MESINPMFAFYLKTSKKALRCIKNFKLREKKMMFKFYRAANSNGFRRPIRLNSQILIYLQIKRPINKK